MNSTSVAVICVALIATPAGYAVERLYHERIAAAIDRTPVSESSPFLRSGREPSYAGSPSFLRQQNRTGDLSFKPGRV
jgi:hypothetical protein